MVRTVSTLLVLLLLVGTGAAFAVTERLKLEPTPITGTNVTHKLFSPVCGCEKERSTVEFRLRTADRLTVVIVDDDGEVVRTIVENRSTPAGPVGFRWDGRDDAGRVVPEGDYRPRVRLAAARRTIVLPNPLTVDVTPPRIELVEVRPEFFSPDGDGRNEKVRVSYRVDKPAHALLHVDGERRVRTKQQTLEGHLEWHGRLDGKPLPAAVYELRLAAEDRAGNVSEPTEPAFVKISYVALARSHLSVQAGTRFGVRVVSDATTVRWRFGGATGETEPGLLVLRAPRRPGTYRLFVEANGRAAVARVLVERRAR